MKALVLSDLHLGSKASHAASRLDDIARVGAGFDRVILNGDTLDRCYTDPCGDDSALRFIEMARTCCASRNGSPELLTGNHDPAISNTHWIYDEHSRTLIFHGDCIRDYTHPTKRDDQRLMAKLKERWAALGGRPEAFAALHENYRQVQLQYLPIINPYKKAKTVMQYALSLIYPPRRPFDIIHYWMTAPKLALKLATGFDRAVSNVVVGHTHKPGSWNINGVGVFNTGSYMPMSGAFAVCIDGERIEHVPMEKLAGAARRVYSLGVEARKSTLAESRL